MTDGPDLRALREATDRTQTQVAAFLGTAQVAVSKWEHGKAAPDEDMVKRLAQLFDTSVDQVLAAVENSEAAWLEQRDMRLADAVRELREAAGLSMTGLAEAVGVTSGAVGFWESGVSRPSASSLQALAEAVNLELEELLDRVGYSSQEAEEYLADEDEPLPIALLLRRGRLDNDLTQTQAAAAIGTSQNNISAIETGVHLPNDEFVEGLTKLYRLDPTDVQAALYASRTSSGQVPEPTLPLPLDPRALPRGRFVRQLRAHRGDRRSDLADWLGVDVDVVARLEDDDTAGLHPAVCQPRSLSLLAQGAQCSPEHIVAAYGPSTPCSVEVLLAEGPSLVKAARSIAELLTVLNLRGITLQDMGDVTGVSREAVRQWRDGRSRPRRTTIGGLETVIDGASADDILSLWERERNPDPEPETDPADAEPPKPGTAEHIFGHL